MKLSAIVIFQKYSSTNITILKVQLSFVLEHLSVPLPVCKNFIQ